MQAPAFCRQCGNGFPSGFEFDGATNVTLASNVAGPCPWCGGSGDVVDGTFDFVNGVMRVVSAPQYTRDRLEHLVALIQHGREMGDDPERIVRAVAQEAPDLAACLRRSVAPETWGTWLGVLVMVLLQLLSSK